MRDIYGSSVVTSNEQTQISTNEDILPSTTDAIDIGSATKRFRNGVFKSCTVNDISAVGTITSQSFIKQNGTANQYLMANGSVDTNTYLTTTSAASTYVTNPTYNLGVSTLNNALIISPMTSDTQPAGYIASSNFSGTSNFQAFDFNPSTYYASYPNYSGLTGGYTGYIETPLLPYGTLYGDWLQIQFPSPINITGYTINSSVSLSQVPSTFTLLSSTDGVNWTSQGSQVAVQWVLGVSKTYTITPITSKYFRLSVGLVGNNGTNFVLNELTLNQNTTTNVIVPTLITNKTTFTNNNELISKQYVDSKYLPIGTPGIVSGYPFNPVSRATGTITSSTKSYYFTCLMNQACIISGLSIYLDNGSDNFRMGIYRGCINTLTSASMTLCGQTAGGILPISATTVFHRLPFSLVSGQSLTFANGEYMTIAFHSAGSTNLFLTGQGTTAFWTDLGFNTTQNYAIAGFPASLSPSSILGGIPQRPCFELY